LNVQKFDADVLSASCSDWGIQPITYRCLNAWKYWAIDISNVVSSMRR
jgi:hypothetical protein